VTADRKPFIDREAVYPQPPERVWRALTEPESLKAWLLPADDFAPRVGHRFHFEGGADGNAERGGGRIDAEVLEADAPRRLAYTWRAAPDQPQTIVTWTLEPVEAGTRVRLTHAPAGTTPKASAAASFRRRPRRTASFRPFHRMTHSDFAQTLFVRAAF
jgi:uncharacterized protein YndB with AHSA1/START domain